MGTRGPKPKSNVVRLLEGTRHKINPDAPQAAGAPVMPAAVANDPEAVRGWDLAVKSMPPTLYTQADVGLLMTHALAYSRSSRPASR